MTRIATKFLLAALTVSFGLFTAAAPAGRDHAHSAAPVSSVASVAAVEASSPSAERPCTKANAIPLTVLGSSKTGEVIRVLTPGPLVIDASAKTGAIIRACRP